MPKSGEFIQYYQKFKDKIYTYFIYRVNFDCAVAEDLSQDVFVKAFKNFDSFDRNRSYSAWIYAIAKNHLVNYYRQKKSDISLDLAPDVSIDERKKFQIDHDAQIMIGKIKTLDEYSKEVLLMRYVDELDNKEIADILGRDEGAVRTQISRALKKLRGSSE
jgi:RNA polymerase sigma-70 factor, ECF subfamily